MDFHKLHLKKGSSSYRESTAFSSVCKSVKRKEKVPRWLVVQCGGQHPDVYGIIV